MHPMRACRRSGEQTPAMWVQALGFLAFAVVFVLIFMREQTLALVSLLLLGIGTAMTGFFPTVVGLWFTTVLMSLGYHYYATMETSLALQWIEQKRLPETMGAGAALADLDSDGDLDLIVGGYSMWKPKARKLNTEEKALLKSLREKLAASSQVQREFSKRVRTETSAALDGIDSKSDEAREIRTRIRAKHRKEMSAQTKDTSRLNKAIHKLVPKKQRQSFVWFYERVDTKASGSR